MNAEDRSGKKTSKTADARVCPICGKPRSERYDPFCSKRCADVDLHRWLKGAYVLPGAERDRSETEDED